MKRFRKMDTHLSLPEKKSATRNQAGCGPPCLNGSRQPGFSTHLPGFKNPRCSWIGEAHSQAWLSKAMPFLENKLLVPTSGLSGAKPFPRISIISTSLPRALSCTPIQSLSAGFRDNRWYLGATPPVSAGMR